MSATVEKSALSEFAMSVADCLERLRAGEPLILTLNGTTRVEIRDLKTYYAVIDVLERAEAISGIRKGLECAERGETQPLDEALAHIRKTYDVSS